MWKFSTTLEHNIHLPDLKAAHFHCIDKLSPMDPDPQKLVVSGVLHPTVQFTGLDQAFYKYPQVHMKMKLISSDKAPDETLLDGIYPMPAMKQIGNMTIPGIGPLMSSLDYKVRMSENILRPGNNDWVEMKTICTPPGQLPHRIVVTAQAADDFGNDVADGPTGYSIVDFRHTLPNPFLYNLGKTFFL
jgi:hypothetical protein